MTSLTLMYLTDVHYKVMCSLGYVGSSAVVQAHLAPVVFLLSKLILL